MPTALSERVAALVSGRNLRGNSQGLDINMQAKYLAHHWLFDVIKPLVNLLRLNLVAQSAVSVCEPLQDLCEQEKIGGRRA